ncbi:MAG TPA: ShlB/FhaC/HecB family hemolysin secretion/activation protein [Candidatus Limnocylindrales bacterium]|nr:ShlB/FhaC/HecB family hemolysin secretion/activation protein [Candidatus Limnocylindrales bacterium]
MSSAHLAAQILPPPPTNAAPQTAIPPRLVVKAFRFEGNRAFSSQELAQVTKPFTERELGSEELEQARRAVTLHYVSHGYVNSGAVIPDQSPTNGIVLMRIVEGKLTQIYVHGNKWLRDGYIRSRLERWSQPPLNLPELQEGLQLLRQNPNVTQINAEMKPGSSPGEGLLDVSVKDEQPFRLGLQVDNQRPPSVGAIQISLLAADVNLTGHSDPLLFRYGIANSTHDGVDFSGADNLEGSYDLPVTSYDTTIGVHGSRLNTSIIEQPFRDLDINSLTKTIGFVLRQPIYQRPNQEIAFSVGFDHRENESDLLGEPFNISPGAIDGRMNVSVLRLSQEWFQRGPNHVLALRSTFNIGLDVWDATDNGIPSDPDAKFFSWVGQAQYVQRLFNTQNQLILRLSGQMTAEPLLALEQISVGGFNTVRGYPENTMVRDRGLISSVEFRVPLLFNKSGEGMLSLAPFFDFGGGWNINNSPSPTTIYSTGIGCLFRAGKHLSAEIYWGYRIRDVDVPSNSGLQKEGIGFRVIASAF